MSIRSIALRNVRLRSRGREIVVSADSSFDAASLAQREFTAESGGTTLDAEGVIGLSPRIDARLTATANRLDRSRDDYARSSAMTRSARSSSAPLSGLK